MKNIAEKALQMLRNKTSFAHAIILTSSGSTPRNAGAGMLIRPDKSIVGTVGGGVLEAHIVKTAQKVLETGAAAVVEYVLEQTGAAAIGAVCGGRAKVLVDFIDAANPKNLEYFESVLKAAQSDKPSYLALLIPDSGDLPPNNQYLLQPDGAVVSVGTVNDSVAAGLKEALDSGEDSTVLEGSIVYLFPVGSDGTVYIFGAGHCGEKLAHILHTVGFGTVVIDDRAEFANSVRIPEADQILVPKNMEEPFDTISFGADSYIVIVTRGHVHDEIVLRRALGTKAGYIGMIGSSKKRETIYQHLLADGFTQADIDRVYSPIGISIGAETPEEIAVSITAELIKVRSEKKTRR